MFHGTSELQDYVLHL